MRRRPGSRARPDGDKSLVGFVVGDVFYAVPIVPVREIVNPGPLTMLPHLPAGVAGVADHRGEVIPIVDLRGRFGLGPSMDQSRCKWVLVLVTGRVVGLIVDQVTDVFGTGGSPLRPAPALGPGEDARGIAGVLARDDKLFFVLDLSKLEALAEAVPADLDSLMGVGA
ncbi:MAG: purine-binding chemotaxis protein CheW [Deltaproteobacteria bacterium]|nr:purine-binding chemotaxis protein CheW [Deltaproteobacteria bacterium]